MTPAGADRPQDRGPVRRQDRGPGGPWPVLPPPAHPGRNGTPTEARTEVTMYGTSRIVSDVMSQTVAAVGPRAPFKEIVQLMQDWQVSALPVIEGEGRVVGVVS
ncbi:CBS domain-containing protein, partial [Streptomyces sp. NPDC001153]